MSFLNSIPDGDYLALATYDEPKNNLDTTLKNALISFGATNDRLNSIESRGSYLLVGKKGVSEGEAISEKTGPRYGSSIIDKYYYSPKRALSSTGNYIPSNGIFERFDSTDLSEFSTVGSSWSVSSGKLHGNYVSGTYAFIINDKYSYSDLVLQARVTPLNSGNSKDKVLAFRYSNSDNTYIAGFQPWDGGLNLGKRVSGSWTLIDSVPFSMVVGEEYNLKVIAIGDRIRVFVDDKLYIDVTDSSHGSGKVGAMVSNGEMYIDDFKAIPLTSSSAVQDNAANDLEKPNEVLSLDSSSHSTSTWSNDNTVDFSWNNAVDQGTQYYYGLDVFDDSGNQNNMVYYYGFEDATDHSSGSFGTYEFSTEDAYNGDYSLKATGSFEFEIHPPHQYFEPGETYKICAWIKEDPACSGCNQYLHSRWYFEDSSNYATSGGDVPNDGVWHQTCRVYTIPTGRGDITNYNWYLGYDTSANSFRYIDDISIERIDSETITTGVDGYDISCDTNSGELSTTSKNIETLTSHTCTFSDGSSNYFHVKSVDNAGNWDDTSADIGPFYIDTVKPLSSIASPSQSTWFNSDFSVSVTDSDDRSGLKTCHYKTYSYDGSSWILTKTNTRSCNTAFTVTVGDSKDCRIAGQDTCKVEVYSEDNAGNVAVVDSRTFNVAWCPALSGKEFIVQTPVTKCFEFDETGYGKLKGSFEESCNSPAPEGSYVVKNSLGNTAFWIDSSCDMCIRGNLFFNYNVLLSGANDFYIKKDSGNYLMKADPQTGDLYVRNHFGFSCNME